MNKKMAIAFVLILLFLFAILAYFYKTMSVNNYDVEFVKVHIKGAVKAPGIYYIKKGSPITLVFNECGGILPNATFPENFDYNAPVYEDITVIIPRTYSFKKNIYE